MKYKIKFAFTHDDSAEYETDDPYEAIQIIKDYDQESYEEQLVYEDRCVEELEVPADYYPAYYIDCEYGQFDITNLCLLEEKLKGDKNEKFK